MSSLIFGLLEKPPYRLTIDQALSHTWLNPSGKESDQAMLWYEPAKYDVDRNDEDSFGRVQKLDEVLFSNTNYDEN